MTLVVLGSYATASAAFLRLAYGHAEHKKNIRIKISCKGCIYYQPLIISKFLGRKLLLRYFCLNCNSLSSIYFFVCPPFALFLSIIASHGCYYPKSLFLVRLHSPLFSKTMVCLHKQNILGSEE